MTSQCWSEVPACAQDVATGKQNDLPLEESGGMSAGLENLNAVLRGFGNLDFQPSDIQDRRQVKKQWSVTSAESSKMKMEEFWEDQGQRFAVGGSGDYQSYMTLNCTQSVGFSNGRKEERTQRGQPPDVVFNATNSGGHPSNQPDLSAHKSEGVSYTGRNTFNSLSSFRVAGNPVDGFVSRRSCPWPEELLCLCRMLKFTCLNARSLQPTTYTELVMLAETRPGHARQCYQLAQLMFFLSAFSCQIRSVLETIMKTLTVLNSTDFEPGQLISAVRKVASVFPLLDMEVQDICTKQVRRALSEDKPMHANTSRPAEQPGAQWQLLAASQQLDIAGENLEMASRLLRKFPRHDEGCSLDSSKCPMHSDTYFQRACPKEMFMILALKFSSIEEKTCLLMEVVKHSKYKE